MHQTSQQLPATDQLWPPGHFPLWAPNKCCIQVNLELPRCEKQKTYLQIKHHTNACDLEFAKGDIRTIFLQKSFNFRAEGRDKLFPDDCGRLVRWMIMMMMMMR